MAHRVQEQIKTQIIPLLMRGEPLLIAVSGGPDSMCLLHAIQHQTDRHQLDRSLLHILTCHHNTRENIQKEIEMVRQQCVGCQFFSVKYEGYSHTEDDLRQRRHQQFVDYCHQYGIHYLLTGHHLDDAIETTLLHMRRGCGVSGLLGLSAEQPHFLDPEIMIVRPLLAFPKSHLLDYCHHVQMPYALDPTNTDPSISQRNLIRQQIAPLQTEQRYSSWEVLYQALRTPSQDPAFSSLERQEFPIITHHDGYDIVPIRMGEWTEDLLYRLYQHYRIVINPRSTTLSQLVQQLNKQSANRISYQQLQITAYQYATIVRRDHLQG